MADTTAHSNEQQTATAFSRQSARFDQLYGEDGMIAYKRVRVRQHLAAILKPESLVLELNCGTGEDAVWLARQGHFVHATDLSAGMLEKTIEKIKTEKLTHYISTENISFTSLEELKNQGPYDHIFSNFAGLNCTGELDKVLASFSQLLRPGGGVTLVLLPRFCLWEFLLVFRGKFKTAFRRFFSNKGRQARVEGTFFKCWYYNPAYLKKQMAKDFDPVSLEGLCSLVPPSYMQDFDKKYPRIFSRLCRLEAKWKNHWPWRSVGDYYIITLRKKKIS
jgi:ubiquinone/menaquinone biosynthesis C-methylase UbiE